MIAHFPTIIYEKRCGVAHISLNRPAQLNAYSVAMRDDFAEVLDSVSEDGEICALLITGQGRAFCAGADLSEFGTAPSQSIARSVRWQRDVWGQLIDLPKPVVVAVHGYCIGSGVEITLLGDVRVAAADTVFAMPELQLGLIPAAGGTQTLPRTVGPSAAMDLLLTGRRFGADEAMRRGIVTRVVSAELLLSSAWELAQSLTGLPAPTATAMKTALRDGADLPLEESLNMERRLAASLMDHAGISETG